MSRFRRLMPLTVVLILLAGCAGTESTAGERPEFCDALTRTQEALLNKATDTAAWKSEVGNALDEMVSGAPAVIKDPVQQMADEVEAALVDGDANVMLRLNANPAFRGVDLVLDQWRSDNCGYDQTIVSAVDYSFSGMPSTVAPGAHSFELDNSGQEVHEMLMVRINDGVTETAQELVDDDDMAAKVSGIAIGVALPGTSDVAFANLEAGRYMILCTIPIGTNADNFEQVLSGEGGEQAPHSSLGMVGEFTVGD